MNANAILTAMNTEAQLYHQAFSLGDDQKCRLHLGRAHILSQWSTLHHLKIHWLMFTYAWKRKDYSEILGQTLRLTVTIPGHLLGRVPMGNIGWTSVGLLEQMPLPEDLKNLLEQEKT